MDIDAPHIREILQSGDAIVRDVGVARRFGDYGRGQKLSRQIGFCRVGRDAMLDNARQMLGTWRTLRPDIIGFCSEPGRRACGASIYVASTRS